MVALLHLFREHVFLYVYMYYNDCVRLIYTYVYII